MRYTRAGKSTHQRVPQEATPWEELKTEGSEQSQRFQRKENKRSFSRNKARREKEGIKRDFQQRDGGGGQREEQGSANFVKLGPRLKPGEQPDPNVKGYGQTKQVKILGKFWVSEEDASRLKSLSKKLKEQGMSRNEIWDTLQNERRKAEKAARRARDKICFNCRQFGHVLMDCPKKKPFEGDGLTLESEICFKCGSTEHTSRDCKKTTDKFEFAKCFICSKHGHIARQCPENTKGIYPSGGCCNLCKEATHLAKDCPTLNPEGKKTEDEAVTARMDNPFKSLEYEGDDAGAAATVPEEVGAGSSSNPKRPSKQDEKDGKPKAKKRRVKF